MVVVLSLGLGFVVYGVTSSRSTSCLTNSACCKGNDCPMKKDGKSCDKMASGTDCSGCENCPMKKDGKSAGTAMKTDDGESCPMMNKGDGTSPMMKHEMKSVDGESCPMMKEDGTSKMSGMDHKMKNGENKNCACPNCQKNKEKKVDSAI